MNGEDFLKKLQEMFEENPKLKKARVEVEYDGGGGCDTCGYGSEVTSEVRESAIYDFTNRLVISVA
jgi:hypothetical protein